MAARLAEILDDELPRLLNKKMQKMRKKQRKRP